MNLTNQPPRLPELLAPAGSPEALEAAIAVHDELWTSRKITHSVTEREM